MAIQIKMGQKVQKIDIIMILEIEMVAKDEYNNDMGDGTGTKNGCDINMGIWNGTKDRYKNGIENGVSK